MSHIGVALGIFTVVYCLVMAYLFWLDLKEEDK